jgi:cytoskeleton protein RodZ
MKQASGKQSVKVGKTATMHTLKPVNHEARTLGENLHQARIRLKIDVLEAAQQLNLKPSVIRALEADEFSSLPGTTFTKGYIRNYSKFLRLSPEAMIHLFEQQTGSISAMDENHPLPTAAVRRFSWRRKAGVLVVLMLVVGVLTFFFWSEGAGHSGMAPEMVAPNPQYVEEQSPGVIVEQTDDVSPKKPSGFPESVQDHASSSQIAGLDAKQEAPDSIEVLPDNPVRPREIVQFKHRSIDSPAPSQPAQAVAVLSTEEAGSVKREEPTEVAALTGSVSTQLQKAPQKAPENAAAQFRQTVEQARQGKLTLKFSDTCWVEVRDRFKNLDHRGLKTNGDVLELSGEPPFDIKLGNGLAVQLSYNGEPVPITQLRRDNVAVFSVGQ